MVLETRLPVCLCTHTPPQGKQFDWIKASQNILTRRSNIQHASSILKVHKFPPVGRRSMGKLAYNVKALSLEAFPCRGEEFLCSTKPSVRGQ